MDFILNDLWNGRTASPILPFTKPEAREFNRKHAHRISVSGYQDKMSLGLVGQQLLPVESGGDYILKPIPSHPYLDLVADLPANEYITMLIASQIFGLETAACGLVHFADGEPAYITRRFDRDFETGATLFLEDMCQVSQRSSATHGRNFKYDGSYEEMGQILNEHCHDQASLDEVFRLVVFNFVTGNGDAHWKNFSILTEPKTKKLRLAPAYDLLSTAVHLPNEGPTALDLFVDYITDAFQELGQLSDSDFRELGNRFGVEQAVIEATLTTARSNKSSIRDLIDQAPLSDEANRRYLEIVDTRLAALAQS